MKYYAAGEMHEPELYKSAWTRYEENVKWKKQIAEGCIHYGTICIKFENMQTSTLYCFWIHTYVAEE